jgi:acyl carrier protein
MADREQAQRVIVAVRRTMGPLQGVVHAAMVLDDAPIEGLTEERMWKAMAPKIAGAWNLHTLTADTPLDFFILFSSFSSMTGNPGQANYCAGNAFLDSLAYYRRSRGLCALTLNWGMVGEVGHVANSPKTSDRFDRIGVSAIPVADTLDVLDELLSSNAVQVGVAQVRWKDYLRSAGSRVPARLAGLVGETGAEEDRSTGSGGVHEILKADETARAALLVTYIRDNLARTIGASPARIDTQQHLATLGVDSLMAVEIRNRIKADLGINIPMANFSQSMSVSALAGYIAERLLEDGRTECSEAAVARACAGAESSSPPRGMDATSLLERINELSDDEVDQQLRALELASNPDSRPNLRSPS